MKPGDRVQTTDGRMGLLADLHGDLAEVMFPDGEEWIRLVDLLPANLGPVDQLSEHLAGASGPQGPSGGANGPSGGANGFGLRLQALFLRHAQRFDPLAGLTNARIEPDPHQISVVRTVIQKRQARMILADEVGMGKTIEAALILKELRARELVERALIVVPASLQMQWQSELVNKFNEQFEIIDGLAARHLGRGGNNPFTRRNLVICSLQFASKDRRAEQIVEAEWDLVVFDEAHRVRRWLPSPGRPKTTKAYELAEMLEPHTPAILMLTATPMQLDPYELYSLMQVVEPGIFRSYDDYQLSRRQLPRLNDLMRSLMTWGAVVDEEERGRIATELGAFLEDQAIKASDLGQLERRETLIDELVEQHPLAGVLVRNRKSQIGGYMGREARQHGIPMTEGEQRLYSDIESYLRSTYSWASQDKQRNAIGFLMVLYFKMLASSPAAIYASIGRRLEKLRGQLAESEKGKSALFNEDEMRELGDDADYESLLSAFEVEHLEHEIAELELLHGELADAPDSKLDKFLRVVRDLLSEEPDTKIVVFTGFKATQKYLADNLGEIGFTASTFHGGQTLDEKERAIRRFRDSSPILISTEAGGEGRNLQFASVIINYDLPWNPMKVEQRIGRLERRGQKRRVRILNLFRCDTIEERVNEVLSTRIRLFEESVGSLDAILGSVEKEIENLLLAGDDEDIEHFERSIEQRVAEARETERVMADLALDRSSFRRDETNALLGEEAMATSDDLRGFVYEALEHYGGTLRDHADDGGQVIQLSSGLATRLELPSAPQRGVFDPAAALEREDLDFFALGNRCVDAIVNYVRDKEPSVATAYSVSGGPTSAQLEIFYEFRSEGRNPRGEVIRHRIGESLEVLEEQMVKIPPLGVAVELEEPSWLSQAAAASQERMQERFKAFCEEVRNADETIRGLDLERHERITAYRRQRFVDRIEEHRAWIAHAEESGTEGQRRILPARQGRLKKDEGRLEKVDTEADRERQKILGEASVPASSIWSAALVVRQ